MCDICAWICEPHQPYMGVFGFRGLFCGWDNEHTYPYATRTHLFGVESVSVVSAEEGNAHIYAMNHQTDVARLPIEHSLAASFVVWISYRALLLLLAPYPNRLCVSCGVWCFMCAMMSG